MLRPLEAPPLYAVRRSKPHSQPKPKPQPQPQSKPQSKPQYFQKKEN